MTAVSLSSCTTSSSIPFSGVASQVNLTWTKSGKLYANKTEIPSISATPPLRYTADLLLDHLKEESEKAKIKTIPLVRERGTTSSFDAETMSRLVAFAKAKGIKIKGPQEFEDYNALGLRQYH